MSPLLIRILVPILLSFSTTIIFTPFSLFFIKKLRLFDDPKARKHPGIIHTKPIPRGGGIPFYLGIFLPALFLIPLNTISISLYSASFLALLVGVLDDKFDISPYIRFFVNIFTASIVVFNGINIQFITNPLGGILHLDIFKFSFFLFSIPFTITIADVISILWIVWVMNMLNWSKGVDGQMPGIVAISSFVIGILSLRFVGNDSSILTGALFSFLITGASLGFLVFNFYPAKIFPGYGATAIYLLLSAVSILSGAKLATAILVMGVPMIDGMFTIFRRIFTGHSPFWHDKKHLHHLLLKVGLSQRTIALFYWTISAILGALSLTLTSTGKFFAILMLIVIVGGGLLFLHLTLTKET